jgi:hypothetical protein
MNTTVQNTYPDNISAFVAGQLADTANKTLLSRTVEPEAGIGFGVAVAQGSNDRGIVAFAGSSASAVLGITVRERSLDANNPNLFAQYEEARVLTEGAIAVTATAAVSAGDAVYVVDATGAFTNSETNATKIANARWDTSTTAGDQIAVVRIG